MNKFYIGFDSSNPYLTQLCWENLWSLMRWSKFRLQGLQVGRMACHVLHYATSSPWQMTITKCAGKQGSIFAWNLGQSITRVGLYTPAASVWLHATCPCACPAPDNNIHLTSCPLGIDTVTHLNACVETLECTPRDIRFRCKDVKVHSTDFSVGQTGAVERVGAGPVL